MREPALARVSLLGPIEITRSDGCVVRPGSGRQGAVFAVLASRANTVVSTPTLLRAVWEPPWPDTAVSMLHTYLSRLRRSLLPTTARWDRHGTLTSLGGAYRLTLVPGVLDVDLVEERVRAAARARAAGDDRIAADHLDAALALWRGEPLVALPGPALRQERRRLRERWLAVRQEQLELAVRLGRAGSVVGDLVALLGRYPLREPIASLLMAALYHWGRQADALHVYASMRARLADELGVVPSAGLEDAYLRILRAEPAWSPGVAAAL
jgi:DNA-binding SARP family transcriptional activator